MINKITASLIMSIFYVGFGFFWYHDKAFGGIYKKLSKTRNSKASVAMWVFKYCLIFVFAFLLSKFFLYKTMISYRDRFRKGFWYDLCVMFNVLVGLLGMNHFRENKSIVLFIIDIIYHTIASICAIIICSYLYNKL